MAASLVVVDFGMVGQCLQILDTPVARVVPHSLKKLLASAHLVPPMIPTSILLVQSYALSQIATQGAALSGDRSSKKIIYLLISLLADFFAHPRSPPFYPNVGIAFCPRRSDDPKFLSRRNVNLCKQTSSNPCRRIPGCGLHRQPPTGRPYAKTNLPTSPYDVASQSRQKPPAAQRKIRGFLMRPTLI